MARQLPDHPAFIPPAEGHPVACFFGWLAVLVIVASASYGTYAWQHKTVTDAEAQAVALQTEITAVQQKTAERKQANEAAATKTVSLLSGKVTLSLPADWVKATAPKLLDTCTGTATGTAVCEAVSTVVPAVYNSDASHFKVSVKSFKNPTNMNAKTWFEQVYKGSLPRPAQGDQTLAQTISGNDAYYFLQNVSGAYKDLYYVVVGQGHTVLLYSRVYEVNTGAKGLTDDFTAYLPAIRLFIDTLQIKA